MYTFKPVMTGLLEEKEIKQFIYLCQRYIDYKCMYELYLSRSR